MYSSVPTWAVKLLSSTRIQLPEKLHKISHNRYNILSYYHYDYYETRCCHTYTHLLSTKSFFVVYTNVVVVNLTSHFKTMSKIHYIHPKFCLWPPAQNQCQIISLSLSKHAFFYITEKHIPNTSNAIIGNTQPFVRLHPAPPSETLGTTLHSRVRTHHHCFLITLKVWKLGQLLPNQHLVPVNVIELKSSSWKWRYQMLISMWYIIYSVYIQW